jgi:hypothetical protein
LFSRIRLMRRYRFGENVSGWWIAATQQQAAIEKEKAAAA